MFDQVMKNENVFKVLQSELFENGQSEIDGVVLYRKNIGIKIGNGVIYNGTNSNVWQE